MSEKRNKALRNLKVGGIYTPIIFGIIFVSMNPMFNFVDPSGELAQKFSDLSFYNPPSTAIGAMLIFCGINALIYLNQYVKEVKKDKVD